MNTYNKPAIETLLRHTLPPTPLILFCYDYYPQVYRQFTAQTTHDDRLRQLLKHCAYHDRLGQLLDQLKRRAPEHFTHGKDYYLTIISTPSAIRNAPIMTNDNSSNVKIGNVSGGISNSVIAGRDVSNTTITISDKQTVGNKKPTINELRQLLIEIQQELSEIIGQKQALQVVSAATPFIALGAEQNIRKIVEKLQTEHELIDIKTVQKSLSETTHLLTSILSGAKSVTNKASVVNPIAEKLELLIEKLQVAGSWVAKL